MRGWITLYDTVWTSEKITAEIDSRARARKDDYGHLEISIPPFNYTKITLQPPQDHALNNDLYSHLNVLSTAQPLHVNPALKENSAVQTSWLRGIWEKLRSQINNLVLFYINRAAQQQSLINEELTATLKELTYAITRETESRQEINQHLRAEFSEGKRPGEKG
jgi:hypothetical protein